ncbi:unnamed protein product [Closterium sp. NIES-64]|nr:unnamed protein product [Closterium sp. NIES-64]
MDGGETESMFPSEDVGMAFAPVSGQGAKKKKGKSFGFESMGLSAAVYRAVRRKGYQVPTPIQRRTLPMVLAGQDVVAMARTGSGKTAAFLIPMIERLKAHSNTGGIRAVILSPTRELALQTFKFTKELGKFTDLRAAVLVGGDSMEGQFEALSRNPDILVATPGRLMHHLAEVEGMSLKSVEYVVFDEADRLFEMGFAVQLKEILRGMPESRQTLLFSATLPKMLAEFARAGLREPQLIRLDTETKLSPDLALCFFTVRPHEKMAALLHLLQEVIQTIIFVATKHHAELLHEVLQSERLPSSVVYGAMDQTARKIHIAKFRAGRTSLLIVTDVAARGIDIPLLDNVINFDFPPKPKLFVHRAGRAARAGRSGTAYSFFTAEELPFVLDLHLFLSKPIRPAPLDSEIEATGGASLLAAREAQERGETVYGRYIQTELDRYLERLRELESSSVAVGMLQKVAGKAMKLYLRTRPAASNESAKRSKALAGREGVHLLLRERVGGLESAAAAFAEHLKKFREGVHLLLRDRVGGLESAAAAVAEHLKKFRPKQTVLELEAEAATAKKKVVRCGAIFAGLDGPIAAGLDVMRAKREAHQTAISKRRDKLVAEGREVWGHGLGDDGDEDEEVGGEVEDGDGEEAEEGEEGDEGVEGEEGEEGEEDEEDEEGEADEFDGRRRFETAVSLCKFWDILLTIPLLSPLIPLPAVASHVPATLSHVPATLSHVPATLSHVPATLSHVPATLSHVPATLSHVPAMSSRQRFEAEVLDLAPDDGEGAQKRKSVFHWDKKSKKYIKLNPGETLGPSGKVRTESGTKTSAGSKGIYKRWKEKTHMRVGGRGPRMSGRGGAGGRVRDELRSVDEVRKMRQTAIARGGGGEEGVEGEGEVEGEEGVEEEEGLEEGWEWREGRKGREQREGREWREGWREGKGWRKVEFEWERGR